MPARNVANMDLMELLDVPPPRGRRSKLVASKRRDLVPPDLSSLSSAKPLEQVSPIQQLRHQHHLLARLLAEGKQLTEAAAITGYSVTYISRLNTQDRAFKDLVTYYRAQVGEVYVNVHERLAGLGLNTVEELQERLAESASTFTHRELMELAELCLDRGGYGPTSTQKTTVSILTSEDIERLKAEVARRQNGKVLQIAPNSQRPPVGRVIEHESAPEGKTEGGSCSGTGVPAEGGKVPPEDTA